MILCILQVLHISITHPRMFHLNERSTPGNVRGVFVACCTFYFCVGVTGRLVPVRWVGVQLYPAAHWQQKQRLSLEDSHIERLSFSPLLTFLRDSQWGIYTSVTSSLHPVGSFSRSALLCLLDLPSEGFQTHPAFSSTAAHLLSVNPSVSEMLLFLQPHTAVGIHQQSWCNVAASWCATTAWNKTSHSFCSLKHLKWDLFIDEDEILFLFTANWAIWRRISHLS